MYKCACVGFPLKHRLVNMRENRIKIICNDQSQKTFSIKYEQSCSKVKTSLPYLSKISLSDAFDNWHFKDTLKCDRK